VSATEAASMLAIFIVDPEEDQLTMADGDGDDDGPPGSDRPGPER